MKIQTNMPLPGVSLDDFSKIYYRIGYSIFPPYKGGRFGVVFTEFEYLVCYVPEEEDISQSLSLAIRELLDFGSGKINDNDFEESKKERNGIMESIMAKHRMNLHEDLHASLYDFFDEAEREFIYDPVTSRTTYINQ